MANKIELSELVAKVLEDEYEKTLQTLEEVNIEAGENLKDYLKANSPTRTKKYARSWRMMKNESRLRPSVTIYNKKYYRLTHLLEKGHQNKDGTRTAARVHIKPAEEKTVKQFEDELKKRLSK